MGDDPKKFDELMARMGVKKLGSPRPPVTKAPSPAPSSQPKKTASGETKKAPAKKASPSPKPMPTTSVTAGAQAIDPKVVLPDPRDAELVELRVHVHALERRLAESALALVRETEMHDARIAELEAPAEGEATLKSLLERRGILGADETRYLIEALASARITDAFLQDLAPRHPTRLERFLNDRVLLSCGREGCPTFSGPALLLVPPVRCDACGGDDVERARRRFQDACLVNGLLVVGLVGGTTREQRLFERAALHHRIAIRFFGSPEDAAVAGAHLVITWRVDTGDTKGRRRVTSHARNPVALMADVATQLLE